MTIPLQGEDRTTLPVPQQDVDAPADRGLLDEDRVPEVDGWWHGFFSDVVSGPPPRRLRELLRLADTGKACFLGGIRIGADEGERGEVSAVGPRAASTGPSRRTAPVR